MYLCMQLGDMFLYRARAAGAALAALTQTTKRELRLGQRTRRVRMGGHMESITRITER
jgi:hypothetical protein